MFVDETGSNLAMTRRYARARRGSRADNHLPYQRDQNVTLIGAMALGGLVGEITFPGATAALAFNTYVTQVLVPNLWTGACVVMANLPAHQVIGIRAAIEAVAATVIYLSPIRQISRQSKPVGQRSKSFSAPEQQEPNLYTLRPGEHRCSRYGDSSRYYWLVYPLLLLYFTHLRTAITSLK